MHRILRSMFCLSVLCTATLLIGPAVPRSLGATDKTPSSQTAATGVTGNIGVPDAQLTLLPLTGKAFGATGPDILFYEDFRGNAAPGSQVPPTSPLIGQWTHTGTYYPIQYDADDLIGGNAMRGYYEPAKRAAGGKISFPPTTRIFVSYWWKVPAGKRFPGATEENAYSRGSHWKPAWISRGEGRGGNDGPDLVLPTWNNRWSIVGNDGNRMMNKVLFTGQATSPDNKWNRFITYLNQGGVSYFQALIKGESNSEITHNVPIFTGTSGESIAPHHWDNINLIGWARTGTENCQTLVDAIYIATGDHPAARVEIGNAQNYADATELYLLTVDSWSNEQITATQRIPTGLNAQGWYIHIHIGDNVHENNGQGRLITD